jgi:peptide/nickel transport system substrate-binding protein
MYTEGWGRGSPERYDYGLINQMYAPWLGNMPGFQESGFWQYENEQLDKLGKQIFTGDFSDVNERNDLYLDMTRLGMEEAVRLWVATVVNSFPATDQLEGVTEDAASGPKSILTLRNAYLPGQNELTIGSQWVSPPAGGSAWNPVGGFGDIYSNDIWRNMTDPLIISDPFTGIPIPFRVEYQVDNAGPGGKVNVPTDAFLWDDQAGEFSSVGAGKLATSKVTFDFSSYFSSNWHHGQPITMADVIYSIFQTFDMVYNEDKANIEFAIATTSKPQLELYRGFRIVDENTLEVYIDFWHFEDDYIASYAVPASLSMPWEVLAAMDEVVFKDRQAYYTDTAAQRFSADWLSLINDGHARLVKNALRDFRDDGTLPLAALTIDSVPLVTPAEAMARYQAAIDWFDQYGLMVISNGPYMLVDFDSAAQFAELQAFRDPSYPFKPGDWYYGASPTIEINSVNTGTVSPGSTASITVAVDGPGVLGVDYLLFDPAAGAVKKYSAATRTTASTFTINLSAQDTQGMLTGDLYYLYVTAYSDSISSLAERRADIVVGAAPSNGTEPPPSDNGTTPPPSSTDDSDGLSPIVIILPIAILAAGGIAYFVVRGGRAKETG